MGSPILSYGLPATFNGSSLQFQFAIPAKLPDGTSTNLGTLYVLVSSTAGSKVFEGKVGSCDQYDTIWGIYDFDVSLALWFEGRIRTIDFEGENLGLLVGVYGAQHYFVVDQDGKGWSSLGFGLFGGGESAGYNRFLYHPRLTTGSRFETRFQSMNRTQLNELTTPWPSYGCYTPSSESILPPTNGAAFIVSIFLTALFRVTADSGNSDGMDISIQKLIPVSTTATLLRREAFYGISGMTGITLNRTAPWQVTSAVLLVAQFYWLPSENRLGTLNFPKCTPITSQNAASELVPSKVSWSTVRDTPVFTMCPTNIVLPAPDYNSYIRGSDNRTEPREPALGSGAKCDGSCWISGYPCDYACGGTRTHCKAGSREARTRLQALQLREPTLCKIILR